MIVSFNYLNKFEIPNITLCNPDTFLNKQYKLTNSIGLLYNSKKLSINYNFNSQSEGCFEYTRNISRNESENSFFKYLYESIVKDRYLFIENFGFAVITNVSNNNDNNLQTKSVSFTSCDKELEFCEVPFLTTEETCTNTIEYFMNLWQKCCPMWTVGYISNDLKYDSMNNEIYRTITDITSENAYNFLINEIQRSFDCIIDFDYVHRKVNIYSQDEYVASFQTDIHISNNLLNSLGIEGNYDNSYTALEVEGDSELEIRMVNPIGNNVVYNFNSKISWMPPVLQEKVKQWVEIVDSYKDLYYSIAPIWYEAQENFENLYQDYLTVCDSLDSNMLSKRNIESSDDTTEAKNIALETINKEIDIDLNGGFREFSISRVIVNNVPKTQEDWDEEKLYYYISGIDEENPCWSYIEDYDQWNALDKVTPLYIADNLDFKNTVYYIKSDFYHIIDKENWNKSDTLYIYYNGLYAYGDKIGEDYNIESNWKNHDGFNNSLIIYALTQPLYVINEANYSYSEIKNLVEYINKKCSLTSGSGIFEDFDLVQLSNYIKTGKYEDNSITVTDNMSYIEMASNAKALMDKSIRKLETVIDNSEKISVDVKGFIFDIAFSQFAEQLKSGCIINVEILDDIFEKIYLTNFSVNYEEKTIEFTLGNKYNKFDIKSLFDEVLGDISKSTHQIANLKKRVYELEKNK